MPADNVTIRDLDDDEIQRKREEIKNRHDGGDS